MAGAYAALGMKAVVHSFLAEMDLALGAATVAISRAGASSLAELAAMRVPSVLIPYPSATDNHQFHNARAFEENGAARLLEQKNAPPEPLAELVLDLLESAAARAKMQTALAQWHAPGAAPRIADEILQAVSQTTNQPLSPDSCETETGGPGVPHNGANQRRRIPAA